MNVRALHQIEVTSRCDLRCTYCPSPNLQRPKVDMTREHFMRAVSVAARFYRDETQFELNLAGIGESTLHPEFHDFIRLAREAMPAMRIVFATNGVNLSVLHSLHPKWNDSSPARGVLNQRLDAQRVIEALQYAAKTGQVMVWVSMHRPELGGLALEVLQKAGVPVGVSVDPSVNADDWAGQVKWKRSYQQELECQWIRDGKVMVMADGRITTCCLDASGKGVIGQVTDDPKTWDSKPYSLCRTCQQKLPKGVVAP